MVKAAVGGLEKMIDTKLKDTDALLLRYLAGDSARQEKLLENQKLIQTPLCETGNMQLSLLPGNMAAVD